MWEPVRDVTDKQNFGYPLQLVMPDALCITLNKLRVSADWPQPCVKSVMHWLDRPKCLLRGPRIRINIGLVGGTQRKPNLFLIKFVFFGSQKRNDWHSGPQSVVLFLAEMNVTYRCYYGCQGRYSVTSGDKFQVHPIRRQTSSSFKNLPANWCCFPL